MIDELLPYYERELTALRQLGRGFAERYPKVASRLLLEGDRCDDPHVERLIESFAFIAARIQKKLDDEFPEITDALFSVLYPHYQRPIPSMSIAQVLPGAQIDTLGGRHRIDRHTTLLAQPVDGTVCRFRTAYPVDLWPIRVAEARIETIDQSPFASSREDAAAVLRLTLECRNDALALDALGIDRLRFFLDGEPPLMHALHELLMTSARKVIVSAGYAAGDARVVLGPDAIAPVGFAEDEGLLDYDPRSFEGYRLLTEYFAFAEKFLFFDLTGLAAAARLGPVSRWEVAILIGRFQRTERLARLAQTATASNFKLGCTPIVNLFRQSAEPIRISHQKAEYPIVPDSRRIAGTEVYSVDAVRKVEKTARGERVVAFEPFYSIRHGIDAAADGPYWIAHRRASAMPGDRGTDVTIALVDAAFKPAEAAFESLSLALTCTNRDLPERLPFGGPEGDLSLEGAGAVTRARLLRKPTPTARPALRRGAQWRLISHLALNHLSIVEGGRDALLEMLTLYDFGESPDARRQIAGITRLASRPGFARVQGPQALAFVRGTDVEIEIDEDHFVGSGPYLLCAVIERFLALYCAVNSFTRLTVRSRQRDEPLARWPARAGAATLA